MRISTLAKRLRLENEQYNHLSDEEVILHEITCAQCGELIVSFETAKEYAARARDLWDWYKMLEVVF